MRCEFVRAIALIAIATSACKREPDSAKPGETPVRSPAASIECPDAAMQRGAAPPDGHRIWCETSAGVSHGPFRSWFPGGEKKTEGTFMQGEPSGSWTTWYATGQLRSRGRYEDGAPVGEWERFDPDGSPAQPEEQPPPAATPVPGEPPPVIGIRSCDLYADRYSKCFEAKAPDAVKPQIREAFNMTIKVWKEAAENPDMRENLETGCQAAYDAVKQIGEAWGCEM